MLLNHWAGGQEADPSGIRVVLLVGMLALAAFGIYHLWRDGRRWLPAVLALWGGLPTLVAIGCAVAEAGMQPRYVTFAVPAVAIAAAIGGCALPKWTPLVAAVAAVAVVAPIVVAQRAPDAKPGNLRDLAAAADDVDADALYFTDPRARSIQFAYPDPLDGLPDISAPPDPGPDPFFPGVRDPATIDDDDVAGLEILVYSTRDEPVATRLQELGCRRQPITRDHLLFLARLYTCR